MLVGRGPGAASVFDRLIVVAGEDLHARARVGASETELREIAVDDATWPIRKQHCGLDRLQPRRIRGQGHLSNVSPLKFVNRVMTSLGGAIQRVRYVSTKGSHFSAAVPA